MRTTAAWTLLPAVLAVAARAPSQDPSVPVPPPQGAPLQDPPAPQGPPRPQGISLSTGDAAYVRTDEAGDYRETIVFGGFRWSLPQAGIEVRGKNALLLADRDTTQALLARPKHGALPRRGIAPPDPRRELSPDVLRQRLESSLRAVDRTQGLPRTEASATALESLRHLYFEGGVVVLQNGIEVIRCERLWISPTDDRLVVEAAELRYTSRTKAGDRTLVVRGDRLVKQGNRWTGRDLTVTPCTAGEPHLALLTGEAEIHERDGEYEIWLRGQTLQFSGTSVVPLPDAHFFTGDQSEFPIKRVSAGYSNREGVRTEVVFGQQWNRTGGAIHEWLTGRPGSEFRGDWNLGVGWVEKRGFPLDGSVTYRADGVYEGRTDAFWLNDQGNNLREITSNFDGSPITDDQRTLLRTQNRVHLGERTHVDLVAFKMGDAAVYSEFFGGDYRTREVPETSVYVHHADGNRLLTVGGRFNLDGFSYRDNRALAEKFTEELPVVTYHWLAQPIATTPWGTPIVLDSTTELGQRRSNYDDTATTRVSDRTSRFDQLIELSAPFQLGPINVRPYVDTRLTLYDDTVAGDSDARLGYEAGIRLGTRLSRAWTWLDEDGKSQGVRHVLAPIVTFANRFHVDGNPGEYRQFDATDAYTESNLVRVEARNLLQRMEQTPSGPSPRDFVFLDLAQDFWPNAGRDNSGEQLGLFYYDFLIRPQVQWLPLEYFAYGFEGEHDWDKGLRTLNTEVRFGRVAGMFWTVEYRTDREVSGTVGLGARAKMLDRWELYGGSQYDLDRDDFSNYLIGLQRNDHDWSIGIQVSYDPYTDNLNFRVEFVPRLFGSIGPRNDRFGDARLYGVGSGNTTDY